MLASAATTPSASWAPTMTPYEWDVLVTGMVNVGAPLTQDESTKVKAYLTEEPAGAGRAEAEAASGPREGAHRRMAGPDQGLASA